MRPIEIKLHIFRFGMTKQRSGVVNKIRADYLVRKRIKGQYSNFHH